MRLKLRQALRIPRTGTETKTRLIMACSDESLVSRAWDKAEGYHEESG